MLSCFLHIHTGQQLIFFGIDILGDTIAIYESCMSSVGLLEGISVTHLMAWQLSQCVITAIMWSKACDCGTAINKQIFKSVNYI